MSSKDSVQKTLLVAVLICIVCSVVVASTAVVLKPAQQANKLLDRNKNILAAAGLYKEGEHTEANVPVLFDSFTVRMADLDEGVFLSNEEAESRGLDPARYEERKAAKDPALSKELSNDEDIAGLGSRERYANVYLIEGDQGIERIVLPVRGYGLWGTLYGFLALEGDLDTVSGIGFYEHKETPGLGGEVDNPKWKAVWVGKEIYGADGAVATAIMKGAVDPANDNAMYQIDGLSGATLTSRGVEYMIHYWMGESGYGPLLNGLKRS